MSLLLVESNLQQVGGTSVSQQLWSRKQSLNNAAAMNTFCLSWKWGCEFYLFMLMPRPWKLQHECIRCFLHARHASWRWFEDCENVRTVRLWVNQSAADWNKHQTSPNWQSRSNDKVIGQSLYKNTSDFNAFFDWIITLNASNWFNHTIISVKPFWTRSCTNDGNAMGLLAKSIGQENMGK